MLASVAFVASCLTPAPDHVTSPDADLAALLSELRDVRRGDLSATSADLSGSSRSVAAAREGAIAREVRDLAFIHPRHVPALVANAALSYQENDPVRAQKYLDQALHHDPTHVSATLLRIRIASEAGNLPYARRRLEEQLELAPDEPALHEAHAGVLYLMGKYQEALVELDLAERLTSGEGGLWRTDYHRGLIAEARGELDQARELYRRSREARPSFDPARRRWRWLEGSSEEPAGFQSTEPEGRER